MEQRQLTISGMGCKHCIDHVKNALNQIEGVIVENVEIGKATIHLDATTVTEQMIREALTNAGYILEGIQ
ncbi:MAG: heavy-metal-associated domain-containing protein [Bacteroidetes bacterium]|nr:heavy-metal-associated domain-containing protein [Bacteroidota bacterium]